MPSASSYVAIAAFLGAAAAKPVDILEKRKAFTVEQIEKGKIAKIGPIAMAKTYQKYNAQAPSDVQRAAAAAASGSVAAVPGDAYDSLYLSPVTAGANTLHLDFDTGSADLWAFSSYQPTSQQSGHDVYNPASSSTSSRKSGYTWNISYGDGSGASGIVFADKVVVGGVTATSQAVEAATSVSAQFTQDVDSDGLLGLAFSSINTVQPQQQTTFFDTVKPQLAKPLFAVTLKKGQTGSYDFGYIDTSKYTGSVTYTNVDSSQGFWQFTASGYSIASGATQSSSFSAIADTGTTLVYLPTAQVTAYYAKVSGSKYDTTQGGYTFPCKSTLPSYSIVIGGVKQTIPGSYINYAPIDSTTCFGGIQRNTGIGFTILGDIFLKSKYVVFEAGSSTPRLGFAQQAGVPSS